MKFNKLVYIMVITLCSIVLISCNGIQSNVTPEGTSESSINSLETVQLSSADSGLFTKDSDKTNLGLYMDLTVDDLIEKLQFNVGMRHYRAYDEYYDFSYGFGWFSKNESIYNFWCETELDDYSFYGIQVGMDYSEACRCLEKEGFEREEENEDTLEEKLDADADKSTSATFLIEHAEDKRITIYKEEGKVSAYSYLKNKKSLDEPIKYTQCVENEIYTIKPATIAYKDSKKNTTLQVEYPIIDINGDSKRSEKLNSILYKYIEGLKCNSYKKLYNSTLDISYVITYVTKDVISFYYYGVLNQGINVPLGHGFTVNIKNGKLLNLKDIGISATELTQNIQGVINSFNKEDLTNYITDLTEEETNFYISENKLAIFVSTIGSNGDYFIQTFAHDFSNINVQSNEYQTKGEIDIFNYLNLSEDNFISNTGLQLGKEKSEEYEGYIYRGYDGNVEVYFLEGKVAFLYLMGDLPGYNFLGISVGMPIKDAIAVLSQAGYECKKKDYTYECYITHDKEQGLTLTTENGKVDMIYYH